ncbi:MAG: hypothetical protein ABR878_01780 [Roseiarcus sp.]|jgi:hypothetical protein
MHTHVRLARPQRRAQAARQVARPAALPRTVARSYAPVRYQDRSSAPALPDASWAGFQPDPYVDYGRFLTAEGGVLIVYKDLDLRLRHTLWRVFAWTTSTGIEGWYLLYNSPLHAIWLNVACLIAMAVINRLIVKKPVEIYRRVEVRPDCLIIEGNDVFWRRYMEGGWPAFRPDAEGNQVLCGIYGTRFVEYLTVRRFEELDRMIEVFASHLQDAMQQLWTRLQ